MTEPTLTPAQAIILEGLVRSGFRFLNFERYARYIPVEKNGFVALLDPSGGKLALFSQPGYLIGDGIAMLIERPEGKAFVWHARSVAATSELLTAYEQFKRELNELLNLQGG